MYYHGSALLKPFHIYRFSIWRPRKSHPCSFCQQEVTDDHKSLQCDRCDKWVHLECQDYVSSTHYDRLLDKESKKIKAIEAKYSHKTFRFRLRLIRRVCVFTYKCPECAARFKNDAAPVGLENSGRTCWLITVIQVCVTIHV